MKFSYTKNPKSDFLKENPNLTKKNLAVGRGGGVARVSDFFFFFFQKNPSLKNKKNCFLFEGVKVREVWLV